MSSDNLDFFDFDNSMPVAKTMSFTCEDCGLYRQCESPKTGVMGNGKKRILIINEFANKTDDLNSDVMSGSVGSYIRRLCNKLDFDFEDDFWRINAVQCTPYKGGKYRDPSDKEAACCRTQLHNVIRDLQPAAIVTLGMKALSVLIGDRIVGRIKKVKWTDFFQTCIPDQALKTWICPTYNPLFFKEEKETRAYDRFLKEAFTSALDCTEKQFPVLDVDSIQVDILRDPKEVRDAILDMMDTATEVAFDYETNSLKSQGSNKKLYCTSLCDGKRTIVFRNNRENNKYLKMILTDKSIGKIAHNLNMENAWTKNHIGKWVENWSWDTCLASHCVANQRTAGLKPQTYINFGIIGYDADAEKYIESTDDAQKKFGANSLNAIFDAPEDMVMRYCGIDSYMSFRLKPIQYEQLKQWPGCLKGFEFFLRGAVTLSKMHCAGISFDEKLAADADAELTNDINAMYGELYRDYPEWNSKTSGKGLETFIYDVLKLKNQDGSRSLEAEVLDTMDHPFAQMLVNIRKLEKIRDTFLAGFFKENTDGFIYPMFSNMNVKTFRNSSNSINWQNISKRNPLAKNYLRKCLVPRPKHRLGSWDYTAVEGYVGAFIYPDATFLAYSTDPAYDLHRDVAIHLLGVDLEYWDNIRTATAKEIRNIQKTYDFSAIFCGGAKNAAAKMWPKYSKESKDILSKCGMKSYEQFENRMVDTDRWLWGDLFGSYGTKRKQTYEEYLRDGYIEMPTGFRATGDISYTQSGNIKVQGTASHMMMHALSEITDEFDKLGLESILLGTVHDAADFDIYSGEELIVRDIVEDCMLRRIHDQFPWFTIDLRCEGELSDLRENGGNWSKMYDFNAAMLYNYCGIKLGSKERLDFLHQCYGKMDFKDESEELEKLEKQMFKQHSNDIDKFVRSGGKSREFLNSFLKGI